MTAFRAYMEHLFLYSYEMKWPNTVRNEEVYWKAGAIEGSTTIKKRRLNCFGRVIRGDDQHLQRGRLIPLQASIYLTEYFKIRSKKLDFTWDEAINIAVNIKTWEAV